MGDGAERGQALAGLYLHVPFCRTKCPYCDFYSVTVGGPAGWLAALEMELAGTAPSFPPFETVYLGGGTPSALPPEAIRRLGELLRGAAPVAGAEVTVELNPDDVTAELLAALGALGANRLSVGVQSFDDESLRFLGRRHDGAASRRALELVREAGFAALSVDLIRGLPGRPGPLLEADLSAALAFAPEHLSCYELTIEGRTPFGRMKERGALEPVPEETGRRLFLRTAERLEAAGYEHYEVSSFARGPERRSRHNRKYWRREPTLGLGPSAHSFDGRRRWWNVRDLDEYCRRLLSGSSAVEGEEVPTVEQVRLERLMLGLRTAEGVPLESLEGLAGADRTVAELEAEGLVRRRGGRLVPTREGLLVADGLPLRFS